MKRLFIIRHAKSDWANAELGDIERPLNERGKTDSVLIGSKLSQKYKAPDVVISSPAIRAMKTAKRICKEIGYSKDIQLMDSLYEFNEVQSYYRAVEQIPINAETAFLFGHNPVISEFAEELSGSFIGYVPTCSVFVVDLEIDNWIEITSGCGKKVDYFYPRMFK